MRALRSCLSFYRIQSSGTLSLRILTRSKTFLFIVPTLRIIPSYGNNTFFARVIFSHQLESCQMPQLKYLAQIIFNILMQNMVQLIVITVDDFKNSH